MKICVLVPREGYLKQAGVRIRYRRITGHLKSLGHTLELLPIDNFRKADSDIYIFSKCMEASSLIIARMLRESGKLVGVDLFDDYFSQFENANLGWYRGWLKDVLQYSDFILCPTEVMSCVANRYAPHLPVHIMRDPYNNCSADDLLHTLIQKNNDIWCNRTLKVAWYGMGDNAYFPAGLRDLVAGAGHLSKLKQAGFKVTLDIATNLRAMTSDALAALRLLPIPYELHEWSEDVEKELLSRSHVVFLPVAAQNFSIAKSLNRAVTALCAGNQILSGGYPLYQPFGEFIYRDAQSLISDARMNTLRLRPETHKAAVRLLHEYADPGEGARGLVEFLKRLDVSNAELNSSPLAILIHGIKSSSDAHKAARRFGVLSVKSPLTKDEKLHYDVRFRWNSQKTEVEMFVTYKVSKMLRAQGLVTTIPFGAVKGNYYYKVVSKDEGIFRVKGGALASIDAPGAKLAIYSVVLDDTMKILRHFFPSSTFMTSEKWRVARLKLKNTTEIAC